jgi:hypothetical protein
MLSFPIRAGARASLLAALAAVTLVGSAHAQAVPDAYSHYNELIQDKALLFMRVGEFDPVAERAPLPPEFAGLPARATSGAKRYFLVQFEAMPTEADVDQWKADGWEFLDYIPNNAWIMRAAGRDLAGVQRAAGVRWADEYRAGYKLDERVLESYRARTAETVDVLVHTWPGENRKAIAEAVVGLGGSIAAAPRYIGYPRFHVTTPVDRLPELAAMEEVRFIEPRPDITLRNDSATGVAQSNNPANRSIWARGITGTGQVIGHADGPVAMASCYVNDTADNTPGPSHRKVLRYAGPTGSNTHGTHTIATSAGFNSNGSLPNAGHAYNAKMAHINYAIVTGWNNASSNLEEELVNQHSVGAYVHTNSWGEDGRTNYTSFCVEIDSYSWNNPDGLVLFAATNQSVLYTPENSKNVLACGNAQRAPNQNNHSSGGVGPTADGRRKPEVYLPGTSTVSASTAACGTTSLTGTSMATPAVAGSALLVREYLMRGFYPSGTEVAADGFTPSGALLKALMVNSTEDMTGVSGYPSNLEGWGRVKLDNILFFDGEARRLWLEDRRAANGDGLAAGESAEFSVGVTDSAEPLKVTLAWMDPPVALNTTVAPVNNLNLEVVSPGGTTYRGNFFTGGNSAPGGTADNINNVEVVQIPSPEVGPWTIRVTAPTVVPTFGEQGFAVVANGALGASARGAVRLSKTALRCGDTLTIEVIDGNQTATSIPVEVRTDSGDVESLTLARGQNGRYSRAITVGNGPVIPGNRSLETASGSGFRVSYTDPDTGTGTATVSAAGRLDCEAPVLGDVKTINRTDTSVDVWVTSSEPMTAQAIAGLLCGEETATANFQEVSPGLYRAQLNGLEGNTEYRLHVRAQDAVGNVRIEDKAGTCYPFTTRTRIEFLRENFDSGTTAFSSETATGSATWAVRANANAYSQPNEIFCPNPGTVTDARLVSPAISLPAEASYLTFRHTYAFEAPDWDGGVLEISVNGGAWTDLGPQIVLGGYTGVIETGTPNPLAGRPAWVAGTIGPMTEVVVNLAPYAGQSVRLRWRLGADNFVSGTGWSVDNVVISRLVGRTAAKVENWNQFD